MKDTVQFINKFWQSAVSTNQNNISHKTNNIFNALDIKKYLKDIGIKVMFKAQA